MTEKKQPAQPAPRRERRSRSAEEDSKAFAWKLLKEEVEKDPQLRERYIAQITGFDIAKAHREATEEKFRLELLKLGFKEMEKEPDWAKDLARDAIYEAMGKKPPEPEDGRPRETPEQFMERMLKFKDFIERMKPKPPGILDQIFTSENLVLFLQALQVWLSQRPQNQAPSGAKGSQTPPDQASREQAPGSGFDDFAQEPPPSPPPSGPIPNPFIWPSTGKKGKFPWEGGETTPPGSSKVAKEQPQPDTASNKSGSSKDVNPSPNAQSETDRPDAASNSDNKPDVVSRNETNHNPNSGQSSPSVSESTVANSETGAVPPQDERTSTVECDNENAPAEPGEIRLSELNGKAANARKHRVNRASVEPPVLHPDHPEFQEKFEPKAEVESPPSVTSPLPQSARPKRAEPAFDFDPDPTPEVLKKLDKRSD